MGALGVLLIGVAIVIGGVLALRLHAFVALILAALVVAVLTPSGAYLRQSLVDLAQAHDFQITEVTADSHSVQLSVPREAVVEAGSQLSVLRFGNDPWTYEVVGQLDITGEPQLATSDERRSVVARLVDSQVAPQLTDRVVFASEIRAATKAAHTISAPEQVAVGFGNTAKGIGILIAFASIVGKCLLESGAADRVVRSALKLTGERGAPAAFVGSGFLLGIPVFFDTVFYLLLPLGKALRLRTGKNYLLYILTIVAGATMAHSLVPPTPGPLLVAGELHVGIGLMMFVGGIVGLGAVVAGYFYALVLNRRFELPLRDVVALPRATIETPERELPPLWLALAPILLPLILIGGAEILSALSKSANGFTLPPVIISGLDFIGDKNVALLIAAVVAAGTLVWKRRTTRRELAKSIQEALMSAGIIILITSAGGAFGKTMQQTGVATLIGQLPVHATPAVLGLAFLITAAVRTAQGSATVAMITAVGILAPLAASGELAFHPVWLAVAIGCGSKPISWMNDSGFWVITQMSGMTEGEGLKYVSTMMIVMGLVGLALTIAGAMLFPMQ
jgi:GntP family gluconate:H+ symporter